MSLRKRTFLVVVAALLGLIAISHLISLAIAHTSFHSFESRIALRNLDRIVHLLGHEVAAIEPTARDWSAWDDTYAYMHDRNPAYITENLTPAVLQNLRLDFMVFLDTSGDLVYGKAVDRQTGEEGVLDPALCQLLKKAVQGSSSGAGDFSGFLDLPRRMALVVGTPILNTKYEGPARGVLVLGRLLSQAEVADIGSLLNLTLTLHRRSDALPEDLALALPDLKDGAPRARIIDAKTIAAYAAIPDVFGDPAILARIWMPREAYQFRQRTWLILTGMLLLTGVAVTGLTMLVLERQVLARLTGLSRRVSDIAAGREARPRVDVDRRNDELTSLAVEINRMLEALDRSREDLRRSEAVARALLDAPGDPAILLDPQGTVLGLNRHAADVAGVGPASLVGRSAFDTETVATHALRAEHLRRVVEEAQPLSFEAETAGRHLSHNLYPITNEAGEVVQVAAYFRDVTAQKEVFQALQESERRYRSFVENSHGIVYQARVDGTLELCQGSVCAITGYSEADLLSGAVAWKDVVHPDDAYVLEGGWGALLDEIGHSSQKHYRIVRKDGAVRWIHEFVQSAPGPDGQAAHIQGVLFDITERILAEHALRESLQAMADIVGAIPSGLLTYRYEAPDRLILVEGNPAAERITGIPLGECRGRDLGDVWPGLKDSEVFDSFLNVVRTGEVFEMEDLQYADERLQGAYRVRAFRLPGEKLGVAFESIAERRRLEEQLHHSQKMEAVGQLAGGVAHDFNNLLSGILGYASLLKLEADEDSAVYEAARTIEQAAERAADLTRQLLGFARRGKFQNIAVNLHDTVQEVIRLLGRTLDKNIRIVQQFRCERPMVTGDPNQLQQVFVNLALNARDAMPAGGDLAFESGLVEASDMPDLGPEAVGRSYVTIAVTDEGCGIPKEHLNRVFEPFFTTKEPGKGTGMGLAMVYGIVRNHGGFVRVYSETGRGATFRVYLPLAPGEAPAQSGGAITDQTVHGSARILLVDDEAVVRNMGSTVLSRLGYTVVTASNGREALDYYRDHADDIDLAIIDMVMPEMGGQACFRAMKRINPGIRAILSSGYGFNGKASELLDEGMLGFIQKPYRISELSVAVAKALNAGRP